MRRALMIRDQGCVFPGCGSKYCQAHHVKHWLEGGETNQDNLVMLCRFHHRLVHEGGFGVRRRRDGRVEVRNPMGVVVPRVAPKPNGAGTDMPRSQAIGPWTGAPAFDSDRLDAFGLDWALSWFMRPKPAVSEEPEAVSSRTTIT